MSGGQTKDVRTSQTEDAGDLQTQAQRMAELQKLITHANRYHMRHQDWVNEFNQLTGSVCAGGPAGISFRSVRSWQREHGLAADGLVGPNTLAAARAQASGAKDEGGDELGHKLMTPKLDVPAKDEGGDELGHKLMTPKLDVPAKDEGDELEHKLLTPKLDAPAKDGQDQPGKDRDGGYAQEHKLLTPKLDVPKKEAQGGDGDLDHKLLTPKLDLPPDPDAAEALRTQPSDRELERAEAHSAEATPAAHAPEPTPHQAPPVAAVKLVEAYQSLAPVIQQDKVLRDRRDAMSLYEQAQGRIFRADGTLKPELVASDPRVERALAFLHQPGATWESHIDEVVLAFSYLLEPIVNDLAQRQPQLAAKSDENHPA